ncbi:MAG: HD domain-containing protein [bacterium]
MRSRIGSRDLDIPNKHAEIIRAIWEFASARSIKCYLVGGYIRDLLFGLHPTDLDLVIPGDHCRALADFMSNRMGFSRPVCFKRFETFHLSGMGVEVQISPLSGTLGDDSSRRDFTVNCLYIDLEHFFDKSLFLIDPTGKALSDLEGRILRTPADPEMTFWLDPLRLLRAIRFSAVLGIRVEKAVLDSIERMAYLISKVPSERIRTELEHILLSKRVAKAFHLLHKTKLLSIILPEIEQMHGFDQRSVYHPYDLFEHSLRVVESLPTSLELRIGGLFHDVGKIVTCRQLEDRNTYYGHEGVSARIASSALSRLRFSRKMIEEVVFLIENHMVNYDSTWSDRAVRRFVRKAGKRIGSLLALLEADRKSHKVGLKDVGNLRKRIRLVSEFVDKSRIDILDGNEIMEILGISPGPLVGEAKKYLLEVADSEGRVLDKREAVDVLKMWFDRRKHTNLKGNRGGV